MGRKSGKPSLEYEDCKRLAVKKKITFKEVFEEARKEALTLLGKSKPCLR